jgi:hypothetical protein
MSYSRTTNVLNCEYLLCHAAITRNRSMKDLGVFVDSKLYFHVDLFSECIKLLGFNHSITLRFSSVECLYVLYFTLVRSKLEYASVVWNCITTTDANKLEGIQQKFASVSIVFPPYVPYSYTYTLEKLSLHSGDIILMHFSFVQVYRGLKSCTSLSEKC